MLRLSSRVPLLAPVAAVVLALLAIADPVAAQAPPAPAPQAETRRATTTTMGDTGLWFVPTAEILPARRWSLSAYRVNFDYDQGYTDVSNWPVTFALGLGDRAEIFGAWTVVTRIDRDLRPLFLTARSDYGGLVNEYPFVRDGWSQGVGDLWVGGKVNLLSQWRLAPASVAVRGMVKLPAGSRDEGTGTRPAA